MKPIAIIQHTEISAPGAISAILAEQGWYAHVVRVDQGEAIPRDASRFGGLVSLGGSMSVHEPLPWIRDELSLIRDADRLGIPVAGHCLGSQLVSVALGGSVRKHEHPEIGWSLIDPAPQPLARAWWGPYALGAIETFQWHYDTFEPPAASELLASSAQCRNQVFVVRGRHLLIQSHLEVTPEIIDRMAASSGRTLAAGAAQAMCDDQEMPTRAARMHAVLAQLYLRWLQSAS